MKTPVLVAALALAASGAAFAEGSSYDYPQPIVAAKSRAEVNAEYRQARADGSLLVSEADWQKNTPALSQRSRAEVRAETLAAIKSGELRQLTGEPNAFDIAFTRNIAGNTVAGQ